MKKILYIILISLFLIFSLLLYSRFIGIIGLKTKEIKIETNKINESYNGLKIIHFSDLHYKKVITEDNIKKLVKEINRIKPDIVIFSGDLLDKQYELNNQDIKFLIKQLNKIEAKYDKLAVIGDSDYKKIDTLNNIYIQSNFTLLDNNYTIIDNEYNEQIFIGGISTYNYKKDDINETMKYFKDKPNINYKIIITHEPDSIINITQNYNDIDLILAGHSINGSINIPLIKNIFLPTGATKYYKPHYKTNNTNIYISNGIGLNNLNFRLFNHPSINFYRLKKNN